MPLFLRAALFTVPRFIAILGMVIGLNRLDVSPLPEWTVALLAYVLHFVITFLFALWVMRKQAPSWGDVIGVAVTFLLVGVMWEIGLYAWMTGTGISEIVGGFTSSSLYLLVIYAIAVGLAGAYKRQTNVQEKTPEGLNVA